jgi:hypothetical protein
MTMTTEMKSRRISISGNFRDRRTNEWAGDGTVDRHGYIECSAVLGEEVYDEIEAQIAAGKTGGIVTATDDGRGWDIAYSWIIAPQAD